MFSFQIVFLSFLVTKIKVWQICWRSYFSWQVIKIVLSARENVSPPLLSPHLSRGVGQKTHWPNFGVSIVLMMKQVAFTPFPPLLCKTTLLSNKQKVLSSSFFSLILVLFLLQKIDFSLLWLNFNILKIEYRKSKSILRFLVLKSPKLEFSC